MGNFSNHIFSIEFDTVQYFEFNDINDNYKGININSFISNKPTPVKAAENEKAFPVVEFLNLKGVE